MLTNEPFSPEKVHDKSILKKTLPRPERHPDIPETAQWLSGEGAGSWFYLNPENGEYSISRYNQFGKLESEGRYVKLNGVKFNNGENFRFTHLSNSAKVRIQQNGHIVEFERVI